MSYLKQFVVEIGNAEFYDSEVCERREDGYLYTVCACNKDDAVHIAEALNSYAPLLAERDALSARVANLKQIAMTAADLLIATAKEGLEVTSKFEQVTAERDRLVEQLRTVIDAVAAGSQDDVLMAASRLVDINTYDLEDV